MSLRANWAALRKGTLDQPDSENTQTVSLPVAAKSWGSYKEKVTDALKNNWTSWLNTGLATGVAIAGIVTYASQEPMRSATVPVSYVEHAYQDVVQGSTTYSFGVPVANVAADFHIGGFVFALTLFGLLGPLGEMLAKWMGWVTYSQRMNLYRWVPESLFTPLLATCILALMGDANTFDLFLIFVLVHVSNIGGLILEAGNPVEVTSDIVTLDNGDEGEPKGKATTWPLVFSAWIGTLSYVVPITLLATSNDNGHISNYMYPAIGLYIAYSVVTSLIQLAYYMSLYTPASGAFCFKGSSRDNVYNKTNYCTYDKWLTGANVLKHLSVVFVLVAVCQDIHVYLPSDTTCQHVFAPCAPTLISTSEGVTVVGIPDICSRIDSSLDLVSIGGFQGVDTSTNAGSGFLNFGSPSSSMQVTYHSSCDSIQDVETMNFLAMDVSGNWKTPGNFNASICCDPDVRNGLPSSQLHSMCFGAEFVVQTHTPHSSNLQTYRTGNYKDLYDPVTLTISGGDMIVSAPNYGVSARFYAPQTALNPNKTGPVLPPSSIPRLLANQPTPTPGGTPPTYKGPPVKRERTSKRSGPHIKH